jgi:hypothetical protein
MKKLHHILTINKFQQVSNAEISSCAFPSSGESRSSRLLLAKYVKGKQDLGPGVRAPYLTQIFIEFDV